MDHDRFDRVEIAGTDELWTWLDANHGQDESVWLVTFKAADRSRYVSRDAVLDALIAYGWVDGRRMVLDQARTMQLISKRRTQDWTATYRARADRLIAEDRMQRPGLHAIEAAKRSGRWLAHPDVDALEVPEDLAAALTARPGASNWFAAAAPSYRRNVLRWIAKAKRPETRAKRLDAAAAASAKGEKLPQM